MGTRTLIAALLSLVSLSGLASDRVPLLYVQISQYCEVPASLLYAVALTESGRKTSQGLEPWPWTLNISGRGHYYPDRQTMFKALMAAISSGKQVDIGLTQLNWYWKYNRLLSPWQATEPVFNLKTACTIIREHYDKEPAKGWFHATGKYHRESNSPRSRIIRKRYVERVRKHWGRL